MKIQNRDIDPLFKALVNTELGLSEARARDRAMRSLSEAAAQYDADRREILTRFSEKDGEGEAKVKDGEYVISQENLALAQAELEILLSEETDVAGEPDRISAIAEATHYKPSFGEAELIDAAIGRMLEAKPAKVAKSAGTGKIRKATQ